MFWNDKFSCKGKLHNHSYYEEKHYYLPKFFRFQCNCFLSVWIKLCWCAYVFRFNKNNMTNRVETVVKNVITRASI